MPHTNHRAAIDLIVLPKALHGIPYSVPSVPNTDECRGENFEGTAVGDVKVGVESWGCGAKVGYRGRNLDGTAADSLRQP